MQCRSMLISHHKTDFFVFFKVLIYSDAITCQMLDRKYGNCVIYVKSFENGNIFGKIDFSLQNGNIFSNIDTTFFCNSYVFHYIIFFMFLQLKKICFNGNEIVWPIQ